MCDGDEDVVEMELVTCDDSAKIKRFETITSGVCDAVPGAILAGDSGRLGLLSAMWYG